MELILGSKSPRRKEILGYFSLPFTQKSPTFHEESVPFHGDPKKYVTQISKGKADDLIQHCPKHLIITADTTVYCEGKIYNKPADDAEACQMISELAGRWHSVFTGVSVGTQEKEFHAVEETRVLFNALTPDQIRHYVASLHLADKAGGYAIQNAGGLIVRKIDGCYYNVMGLPINTVRDLLLKFDIDLWDHIK